LVVPEPQEKTANPDKASKAVVSGKNKRHRTLERIVNLLEQRAPAEHACVRQR
jgi:hypothetical protein